MLWLVVVLLAACARPEDPSLTPNTGLVPGDDVLDPGRLIDVPPPEEPHPFVAAFFSDESVQKAFDREIPVVDLEATVTERRRQGLFLREFELSQKDQTVSLVWGESTSEFDLRPGLSAEELGALVSAPGSSRHVADFERGATGRFWALLHPEAKEQRLTLGVTKEQLESAFAGRQDRTEMVRDLEVGPLSEGFDVLWQRGEAVQDLLLLTGEQEFRGQRSSESAYWRVLDLEISALGNDVVYSSLLGASAGPYWEWIGTVVECLDAVMPLRAGQAFQIEDDDSVTCDVVAPVQAVVQPLGLSDLEISDFFVHPHTGAGGETPSKHQGVIHNAGSSGPGG